MDKKVFVLGLVQFALTMIESAMNSEYNQGRLSFAKKVLRNLFESNSMCANQASEAVVILRDATRTLDPNTSEWHFCLVAIYGFEWHSRTEDAPDYRGKDDSLERCNRHYAKAIGLVFDSVPSSVFIITKTGFIEDNSLEVICTCRTKVGALRMAQKEADAAGCVFERSGTGSDGLFSSTWGKRAKPGPYMSIDVQECHLEN